jgi:hypothetical protein
MTMSTRRRTRTRRRRTRTDVTFSPNTPSATLHATESRPRRTTGTGKTTERLEREAAARRAVFAAALAGFVALFGLVAAAGKPVPAVNSEPPAPVSDVSRGNRVLAEVPITGLNGGDSQTIIRIVAPEPGAPAPHVRTRAS